MRLLGIATDQVAACPRRSLRAGHYRDDGSCLCTRGGATVELAEGNHIALEKALRRVARLREELSEMLENLTDAERAQYEAWRGRRLGPPM